MNFQWSSAAEVQALWNTADAADTDAAFQALFNELAAAFADKECPI